MSECNESKMPTAGHFSWNELLTTNPDAAKDFYSKLFGWHAAPFVAPGMPEGAPPYTLFRIEPSDAIGAAGMMQAMCADAPSQWIPYVVVTNADDSLAKAIELGAKVLVPVMSVGEVGRIALVQDPLGATIGLHELSK